jgi:hypothetical protein
MSGSTKTARSYRGTVVDDNAIVSINLKWLGQIFVLAGVLGWSGYKLLDRLESLEEQMLLADEQITNLLDRHVVEEQGKRAELEEKVSFYEKEFNINPLSWGKRKKK